MTGTATTPGREQVTPSALDNVIGPARNTPARRWFEIRRVWENGEVWEVSSSIMERTDTFSKARKALTTYSRLNAISMGTLAIVACDLIMIGTEDQPTPKATADRKG